MKRKKLYSMLALGMAMSFVVSIPVSAATSVNTGSADFPVTGEVTTDTKEDGQEVNVGKDESGAPVIVVIPNSVNSEEAINNMVNKETSTAIQGGETLEDESLAVPDQVEEGQEESLKEESKKQFGTIKADEIKADRDGLEITVVPVAPTVQSVAKDAAAKMAETVAKKMGATLSGNVDLMASADISIPSLTEGEDVRVTIPMNNGEKPDPAKYIYYVLHYNTVTGIWETLDASITEDGIVVATFNSLSPVFVVKAEKTQAPATDDSNGDDGSNGGNSGDSGSSNSNSNSSNAASEAKAAPALAASAPVDPSVSPKTGE